MKLPLLLMAVFLLLFSSCDKEEKNSRGTFTDPRDGKVYQTIVIGNQEWMGENLAFEPSNGTFWAYENDTSNMKTYGYLYDWQTAKIVCPPGWHLPSDAEWSQLTDYLSGESTAGGKLKEIGTTHWLNPNTGATNEVGFTALPGGYRNPNGKFFNIGYRCYWWSATEKNSQNAFFRFIFYDSRYLTRYDDAKENGYSVRCLRD